MSQKSLESDSAFVSITAPGAGISVVSVLGQSFPACRPCRRLALHGGELDAPRTKRREASRLVGRSGLALQLPARLTTGPCSIPGVSRGPAAASRLHSQGRSGARLDNRAAFRKRSSPVRAETGPVDRLLRPRAGWLGTRRTARETPQRRGRGPGSGRRPVQPAEA